MARRSRFWCVVIMQLAALAARAQMTQQPSLEIYVYNRAGVSEKVISEAEDNASRILRRSGIPTIWIKCSPYEIGRSNCIGLPKPHNVILQVVNQAPKLNDDVFGASFLGRDGSGQYTDVYYDRVKELKHRDWRVPIAGVLGHVIAHEIGHLLLGLNAHSNSGIMRGVWSDQELEAAERGRLLFSSQQSRVMRERLMTLSAKTMASARMERAGTP